MERKSDDISDKPPPPDGYKVPEAPNEPPAPSDQPDDWEMR